MGESTAGLSRYSISQEAEEGKSAGAPGHGQHAHTAVRSASMQRLEEGTAGVETQPVAVKKGKSAGAPSSGQDANKAKDKDDDEALEEAMQQVKAEQELNRINLLLQEAEQKLAQLRSWKTRRTDANDGKEPSSEVDFKIEFVESCRDGILNQKSIAEKKLRWCSDATTKK